LPLDRPGSFPTGVDDEGKDMAQEGRGTVTEGFYGSIVVNRKHGGGGSKSQQMSESLAYFDFLPEKMQPLPKGLDFLDLEELM